VAPAYTKSSSSDFAKFNQVIESQPRTNAAGLTLIFSSNSSPTQLTKRELKSFALIFPEAGRGMNEARPPAALAGAP